MCYSVALRSNTAKQHLHLVVTVSLNLLSSPHVLTCTVLFQFLTRPSTMDTSNMSDSSHLASPVCLPDSAVSSSAFFFKRNFNSIPNATTSTPRRPYSRSENHSHAFDSLPWITALDSPTDALNLNPSDIADLSQLPLPRFSASTQRKPRSSVRVLSPNPDPICSDIISETDVLNRAGYTPASASTTPPSLFDPSRTTFYDLMPIIDSTSHGMNISCLTPPRTSML